MSEEVFNNAIDLTDVPRDQWRKQYIGPGYRNVFYTTNHNREGQIILFGYAAVLHVVLVLLKESKYYL